MQGLRTYAFWLAALSAFSVPGRSVNAQKTNVTNVTLAWLYIMDPHDESGATWVVESETAFRLAVQEVNANPAILPNFHINPLFLDTDGSQVKALEHVANAVKVDYEDCSSEDHGIVAVMGTGYSSAARAAAMYCSIAKIPMISPGSTWAGLVDKTAMPYFLRSIAPASDAVAGLAELAYVAGWRNVALIIEVVGAIEDDGTYQHFAEAADRLGVKINTKLSFVGGVEAKSEEFFEPIVDALAASGNKVTVVYMRSVHFTSFARACKKRDMLDEEHVWLSTVNILESEEFYGPGVIFTNNHRSSAADDQEQHLADLWQRSTSAEDGAVLWDNGDGQVDAWAAYVYDTVHMLAGALDSVVAEHGHAGRHDGALLLEALLDSAYVGATGEVAFSRVTQDRVSRFDFFSRLTVTPAKIGSYNSDPAKSLDGASPVEVDFTAMGWLEMPEDGSQLNPSKSSVVSAPTRAQVGEVGTVLLALTDSFQQPIVPVSQLPEGLDVRWMSIGGGEGGASWALKTNANASSSLTTLEVSAEQPGEYELLVTFEGEEVSGMPVRIEVVAPVATAESESASQITYIAVSSVFVVGFGAFVGWMVWKYPEYAKIIFNFLIEMISMSMNTATRIIDVITDGLATAAVMTDPELNAIEPWYLGFLCLSALFMLGELYYFARDCLKMRRNMSDLAENSVSKLQIFNDQNKRAQRYCALSLLNCLVEDVPMLVLNLMIILSKEFADTTVYQVSVMINLLMLGWKFGDAKVLTTLRDAAAITKKFEHYVDSVCEAADSADSPDSVQQEKDPSLKARNSLTQAALNHSFFNAANRGRSRSRTSVDDGGKEVTVVPDMATASSMRPASLRQPVEISATTTYNLNVSELHLAHRADSCVSGKGGVPSSGTDEARSPLQPVAYNIPLTTVASPALVAPRSPPRYQADQHANGRLPYANGHLPYANGHLPYANGGAEQHAKGRLPYGNGHLPYANGGAEQHANGHLPYGNGHLPYANGGRRPYANGHLPYANGHLPYASGATGGAEQRLPYANGHLPYANGGAEQHANGHMPYANGGAEQHANGHMPYANGGARMASPSSLVGPFGVYAA